MNRAFVLMTAMPPTRGHRNLIRFAAELAPEVRVIVTTQPGEPYVFERYEAVRQAMVGHPNVRVFHHHRTQEQDPAAPGFWEMWDDIMRTYGFQPGDFAVSSEPYGATLAARLGGTFFPYDPGRELYYTKATSIRNKLQKHFHEIMPEFQHVLRTTVTIFGAESTGKTTLSKELASRELNNGHWLFEWARPYLETVGPEITREKMIQIWKGQLATQRHAKYMYDKPFVIHDTDLFSTIGYWEQPHWKEALGPVPDELIKDALNTKSDLYIITQSNIPFEQDSIRYGVDKRESSDEFWLGIADKYGLNYQVLTPSDFGARVSWASKYMQDALSIKAESIFYDRKGL